MYFKEPQLDSCSTSGNRNMKLITKTYCCWPHQERLETFPEYVIFKTQFRNIWLSPLTTGEERIHYLISLGITNLAQTSGTWDPKSFIKGRTETFHRYCTQITESISASTISRHLSPFNKSPSLSNLPIWYFLTVLRVIAENEAVRLHCLNWFTKVAALFGKLS